MLLQGWALMCVSSSTRACVIMWQTIMTNNTTAWETQTSLSPYSEKSCRRRNLLMREMPKKGFFILDFTKDNQVDVLGKDLELITSTSLFKEDTSQW